MLKTPILFLVFNRPDTTSLVFDRIRQVKPKYLYVAADGPRIGKGEGERCELTRAIATAIDWDCEVKTLFRDINIGCGRAVSEAITWFFDYVEAGIILEDDCLVDPTFFNFASDLLQKYQNDEQVMHISANGIIHPKYPIIKRLPFLDSYSFVQYPLIWGWATWKRAWGKYNFNLDDWEDRGEEILHLNFKDVSIRAYWRTVFNSVHSKEVDTWDYQWLMTCLKSSGLSIIPKNNLVENIGFGPEATHTFNIQDMRANMQVKPIEYHLNHPKCIRVDYNDNINIEKEVFGLHTKQKNYRKLLGKFKRKIFNL